MHQMNLYLSYIGGSALKREEVQSLEKYQKMYEKSTKFCPASNICEELVILFIKNIYFGTKNLL